MLVGVGALAVVERALVRRLGRARREIDRRLVVEVDVEVLLRAGLIERQANPNDRRSQLVYLTEGGKARLAAASPAVRAVEQELEADFTAADREAARAWLQRMVNSEVPIDEP